MHPGKISSVDKEHLERLLELQPELGRALGFSGHDDRLPDLSPDGRKAALEVLLAWKEARFSLSAPPDAEPPREFELDQRQLLASIELHRFCDEESGWRERDPDVVGGVREVLARDLLDAREDPARWAFVRGRLAALPEFIANARKGVTGADALLVPPALDAVAASGALIAAIAREAQAGAAKGTVDRALAGAMSDDAARAKGALDEHGAWLERLPTKQETWRLGTERFDRLLHLRALDVSAAEVRELSRSMAEQMRVEERRIAQRLLRKKDLGAALKLARAQAPVSVDEILAWGSELVEQARAFLVEGHLFPMPERADLVLTVAPAGFAVELDRAALIPAPRFSTGGRARLLLQAPSSEELASFSVADLENITAALVYPGVHWLTACARERTCVLRAGAPLGLLATPLSLWAAETTHGWAHHAEELMRELMFRDSPAARFLAARRALYRAVLARLDVGLHTAGMTVDVAVQHLVSLVGLTAAEARRDVVTLARRPTRGLSELVGKMRLQHLRREAKLTWRDAYSEARLHELVVRGGAMPFTYHFDLLDAPPVYSISDGTSELKLGDDDPYVKTSEEGGDDDDERRPRGGA